MESVSPSKKSRFEEGDSSEEYESRGLERLQTLRNMLEVIAHKQPYLNIRGQQQHSEPKDVVCDSLESQHSQIQDSNHHQNSKSSDLSTMQESGESKAIETKLDEKENEDSGLKFKQQNSFIIQESNEIALIKSNNPNTLKDDELNEIDLRTFELKNIEPPKNEMGDPVYCICRQPYATEEQFMIQCDICAEWYHGDCIGLKEVDSLDFYVFECFLCRGSLNCTKNYGSKDSCNDLLPLAERKQHSFGLRQASSLRIRKLIRKIESRIQAGRSNSLSKEIDPYSKEDYHSLKDNDVAVSSETATKDNKPKEPRTAVKRKFSEAASTDASETNEDDDMIDLTDSPEKQKITENKRARVNRESSMIAAATTSIMDDVDPHRNEESSRMLYADDDEEEDEENDDEDNQGGNGESESDYVPDPDEVMNAASDESDSNFEYSSRVVYQDKRPKPLELPQSPATIATKISRSTAAAALSDAARKRAAASAAASNNSKSQIIGGKYSNEAPVRSTPFELVRPSSQSSGGSSRSSTAKGTRKSGDALSSVSSTKTPGSSSSLSSGNNGSSSLPITPMTTTSASSFSLQRRMSSKGNGNGMNHNNNNTGGISGIAKKPETPAELRKRVRKIVRSKLSQFFMLDKASLLENSIHSTYGSSAASSLWDSKVVLPLVKSINPQSILGGNLYKSHALSAGPSPTSSTSSHGSSASSSASNSPIPLYNAELMTALNQANIAADLYRRQHSKSVSPPPRLLAGSSATSLSGISPAKGAVSLAEDGNAVVSSSFVSDSPKVGNLYATKIIRVFERLKEFRILSKIVNVGLMDVTDVLYASAIQIQELAQKVDMKWRMREQFSSVFFSNDNTPVVQVIDGDNDQVQLSSESVMSERQACDNLASSLLRAVQEWSEGDTSAYRSKLRELMYNLKRNQKLNDSIKQGLVSFTKLVRMTNEEMATDKMSKLRSEIIEKESKQRTIKDRLGDLKRIKNISATMAEVKAAAVEAASEEGTLLEQTLAKELRRRHSEDEAQKNALDKQISGDTLSERTISATDRDSDMNEREDIEMKDVSSSNDTSIITNPDFSGDDPPRNEASDSMVDQDATLSLNKDSSDSFSKGSDFIRTNESSERVSSSSSDGGSVADSPIVHANDIDVSMPDNDTKDHHPLSPSAISRGASSLDQSDGGDDDSSSAGDLFAAVMAVTQDDSVTSAVVGFEDDENDLDHDSNVDDGDHLMDISSGINDESTLKIDIDAAEMDRDSTAEVASVANGDVSTPEVGDFPDDPEPERQQSLTNERDESKTDDSDSPPPPNQLDRRSMKKSSKDKKERKERRKSDLNRSKSGSNSNHISSGVGSSVSSKTHEEWPRNCDAMKHAVWKGQCHYVDSSNTKRDYTVKIVQIGGPKITKLPLSHKSSLNVTGRITLEELSKHLRKSLSSKSKRRIICVKMSSDREGNDDAFVRYLETSRRSARFKVGIKGSPHHFDLYAVTNRSVMSDSSLKESMNNDWHRKHFRCSIPGFSSSSSSSSSKSRSHLASNERSQVYGFVVFPMETFIPINVGAHRRNRESTSSNANGRGSSASSSLSSTRKGTSKESLKKHSHHHHHRKDSSSDRRRLSRDHSSHANNIHDSSQKPKSKQTTQNDSESDGKGLGLGLADLMNDDFLGALSALNELGGSIAGAMDDSQTSSSQPSGNLASTATSSTINQNMIPNHNGGVISQQSSDPLSNARRRSRFGDLNDALQSAIPLQNGSNLNHSNNSSQIPNGAAPTPRGMPSSHPASAAGPYSSAYPARPPTVGYGYPPHSQHLQHPHQHHQLHQQQPSPLRRGSVDRPESQVSQARPPSAAAYGNNTPYGAGLSGPPTSTDSRTLPSSSSAAAAASQNATTMVSRRPPPPPPRVPDPPVSSAIPGRGPSSYGYGRPPPPPPAGPIAMQTGPLNPYAAAHPPHYGTAAAAASASNAGLSRRPGGPPSSTMHGHWPPPPAAAHQMHAQMPAAHMQPAYPSAASHHHPPHHQSHAMYAAGQPTYPPMGRPGGPPRYSAAPSHQYSQPAGAAHAPPSAANQGPQRPVEYRYGRPPPPPPHPPAVNAAHSAGKPPTAGASSMVHPSRRHLVG